MTKTIFTDIVYYYDIEKKQVEKSELFETEDEADKFYKDMDSTHKVLIHDYSLTSDSNADVDGDDQKIKEIFETIK